jgi:hypothetical protein
MYYHDLVYVNVQVYEFLLELDDENVFHYELFSMLFVDQFYDHNILQLNQKNLYQEFLKLHNLNKKINIHRIEIIMTYDKLYDHVEQQYKNNFHHRNSLEDILN